MRIHHRNMVVENVLGTMGATVGTSALAGGVTGFITKKLIKLAVALTMVAVVGLTYLDYRGILTVHWPVIDQTLAGVRHTLGVIDLPGWVGTLGATVPVGAGFLGGFALGYLKG